MSKPKFRPHGLTRREFAALGGSALLAACTKDLGLLAPAVPPLPGAPGLLASVVAAGVPSVVFTPGDISNFTVIGNQQPAVGATVGFNDASQTDVSGLSAADPAAATGIELDLTATFQVTPQGPDGVDAGFHVAISDGTANRAAIAACIQVNGISHIGLVSTGARDQLSTYPAFIAAEWQAAPLTLKLRRTTEGGVQLLELNGAPPAVRTELLPQQAPPRTRPGNLSEFGCFSAPATLSAEVRSFFTERPAQPVAGRLTPTVLRIRDSDSTDKLRLRADYQLGAGSNLIDPTTEPVKLTLATAAGVFYTRTLTGFEVSGKAPRRRWTATDAARAATGIERCIIDEDPNNGGSFFLRDVNTDLATADFTTTTLEVLIGDDRLGGTARLFEKPVGSGKWRLIREA